MFIIKYFPSFCLSFFYEGKNKDEIIFLFPLCEGDLMKYLVIHLTKTFHDESKKTIFLGYTVYYVFHDALHAKCTGAG